MKHIFLRIFCFAILSLTFHYTVFSQKTSPVFEIKVGSILLRPDFIVQAATGELIIAHGTKLMAIDPIRQSVIWESSAFPFLDQPDVSVIPGTQFIIVEKKGSLGLCYQPCWCTAMEKSLQQASR